VAATLAACAVGPDYHRPTVHDGPDLRRGGAGRLLHRRQHRSVLGQFNDDLFNGLVIEALAANHDLRIALAHLQQARALRTQAKLDLLPTVTAQGGYTDQQYPAAEVLRRRHHAR
jgi:multidrug efflux system outer membrane protein